MIELVLVYCLAIEPDRCMERREMREEVASPIECTLKAQTTGQKFVVSNPRYRLSGWRCEVDKPREHPV
ncbi:MAG: hypothetical protein H7Z10_11335 [Gemmatimonadaceae bacterium]|nr:hypothetical protein [Acetobacteraceae bacterium]